MILPRFEYHQPATVREAVAIAQACDGNFDFISGGTDLLPNYKNRLNARAHVISLSGIKELFEITPERIGAMVRLQDLASHTALQHALPVLPHTAALIATPLIRESGTVGGNILLDTRCYYFN